MLEFQNLSCSNKSKSTDPSTANKPFGLSKTLVNQIYAKLWVPIGFFLPHPFWPLIYLECFLSAFQDRGKGGTFKVKELCDCGQKNLSGSEQCFKIPGCEYLRLSYGIMVCILNVKYTLLFSRRNKNVSYLQSENKGNEQSCDLPSDPLSFPEQRP